MEKYINLKNVGVNRLDPTKQRGLDGAAFAEGWNALMDVLEKLPGEAVEPIVYGCIKVERDYGRICIDQYGKQYYPTVFHCGKCGCLLDSFKQKRRICGVHLNGIEENISGGTSERSVSGQSTEGS